MIRALFYRRNGLISGFRVSGHAGFDESGRDIVCASVTSAVQMAANTITDVLCAQADVTAQGETVSLRLPAGQERGASQDILRGLQLQLKLLNEQFHGYITVEDQEV